MRPFVVLSLLVLLVGLAATDRREATGAALDSVEGQLLVRFVPGTLGAAMAAAHRANTASVQASYAVLGLDLVEVRPGQERAAQAVYERNPNVLYAELNYIRSIPEPLSHSDGEVFPADYYFDQQWGLHNVGQMFYCIPFLGTQLCFYVGTEDADIDYPEGLAVSNGSASVTIAVLDTGIDYAHPDLVERYGGGQDFVNGDDDPQDDHGHGTHVSGTAAASINNLTGSPGAAEGVAGVAPDATVIAGKICDASGMCPDSAIIDGLLWAAGCDTNPCGPRRADVINMSIGGPSPSQAIDDAVQAAWGAGAVLVAAAGNAGSTALSYPAAYDNVISVAAFDEDGRRASFSNYGSWVDVSAPGNVIISTWPMAACAGAPQEPGDFGCYNFLSGTSMATPHVAGVAAMVFGRADITSNAQVVEIIKQSANPDGVANVPLNSWTTYGGVNLHDALSFGAPAGNAPPSATDLSIETEQDTQASWTPQVSDPDAGDTLTCSADATSVAGGAVTVAPDCSDGTYTPPDGFTGDDSFGYTVSDGSLTDQGAVTVTVTAAAPANQPPVANAGPDQTVTDADNDGSELVTLDGSGSSDPDGEIVSYEWHLDGVLIATGATPTVSFEVGVHTVVLTVTDNDGDSDTDEVTITVLAGESAAAVHIGNLDADTVRFPRGAWGAIVTATVHDSNEALMTGYVVVGDVTQGGTFVGTFNCTADASGTCDIATGQLPSNQGHASFTVTGVNGPLPYDPSANHDPDGDSDGTTIALSK